MVTRFPAAGRGDDLLVSEVLTRLLRTLPLTAETLPTPRVDITERVQHLNKAAMAGQEVGMVGLHGMGGIGNTTLATAFFTEQSKLATFRRRVLLHVGIEATGDMVLPAPEVILSVRLYAP